ncbi:hypothetical protein [Bacillus swezeyi]
MNYSDDLRHHPVSFKIQYARTIAPVCSNTIATEIIFVLQRMAEQNRDDGKQSLSAGGCADSIYDERINRQAVAFSGMLTCHQSAGGQSENITV